MSRKYAWMETPSGTPGIVKCIHSHINDSRKSSSCQPPSDEDDRITQ
ncbi:MAG: hypothetical protein UHW99_00060 [Methanobrevibacter sp.]|nr:hypothetical protein [Methanobrevibacter sp.]